MNWVQGSVPFEKMDLLFSYLSAMCSLSPEIYNHGYIGHLIEYTDPEISGESKPLRCHLI